MVYARTREFYPAIAAALLAATLARECEMAMQAYLAGSGEAALRRAYLAGRQALANGMGVLDILAAHQAPIIRALQSQVSEQDSERAIEQVFHCLHRQ